MAYILNEQQMIEDNVFKYEERLSAKSSRFLDKTPSFVTYYHVNVNDSMVDDGFQNVENIIGPRSPIRFQKIQNFPLYGLDSIVIQLEDTDFGLDGSYESDAIILPNTIKPVENDFFIINHLRRSDSYIFRIVSVDYDNIKSNNYYKISFKLEFIDKEAADRLNNQVSEKFNCLLENIGTENKCIIEEENFSQLQLVDSIYGSIANMYLTLYYNERYNCIIGEMPCCNKFYDPFLTRFINDHQLFNQPNNLDTLILNDEGEDSKRKIKYEKSFYRFIEKHGMKGINNFYYYTYSALNRKETTFARWYDKSVYMVDIPIMVDVNSTNYILSDQFIESLNKHELHENKSTQLIQRYILNEELTIYDIDNELYEDVIDVSANMESFFFIPVILYIIKHIKSEFILSSRTESDHMPI